MPGKFEAPRDGGRDPKRRRRRRRRNQSRLKLILPGVLVLLAVVLLLTQCFGKSDEQPRDAAEDTGGYLDTADETIQEPEQNRVVSTATVASQGDLLMHKPVFNTCRQSDGTYDFGSLFRYMADYTSAYDYAVANLETTLGGDDFPYQGNPSFNCPDPILDGVVEAGYDMLLTANNHSYDTLMTGINRTLQQARGKGLDTLGTRLSEDEARYSVVDVNGIKIGMVCYTYTLKTDDNGRPVLNDNSPVEKPAQINYFSQTNLNKFYSEMETILADMEADGAEATMLYIHWGKEYELMENDTQRTIAQKMCDLGIDVIVGGHPHVVQPMDLLSSTTDPNHKTVCIYSLGNAVSNQRLGNISYVETAHTEDGVLFSVTFEKYADGTVYVADADVLPTWVVMYGDTDNPTEYNILPLDKDRESEWMQMFNLDEDNFSKAKESYTRTMNIVEAGLTECRDYLAQAKADREAKDSAPAAGSEAA